MNKKKYQELQKKHKLPKYEEMDAEFEISSIENEEGPLREIRKKMQERIDAVLQELHNLIQPDPSSVSSVTEYYFFDDAEREKISNLFKEFMALKRKSESTAFGSDGEHADFIFAAFKKWAEVKIQLKEYFSRISDSWLKEETKYTEPDYMR